MYIYKYICCEQYKAMNLHTFHDARNSDKMICQGGDRLK